MSTQTPDDGGIGVEPNRAYLGLPGTGKTTTLLDVLSDELDGGTHISDIVVSTFRRRMAEEFRERAKEVTGELPDDHWLRTTHSACFHLLGLSRDDVVDDGDRATVAERVNAEFQKGATDELLKSTNASGFGADLFHVYSYCRNTGLDPTEDWRKVPALPPETERRLGRTNGEVLEDFIEVYESHKSANRLVDFDDMLVEVRDKGLVPDADVLIEDEFQDKSPLQVEIFEKWAREIDRVYVAGDPYQAIYGFMGTKPAYMESAFDRAESPVTLDTSYRFGPDLWEMATTILTRADYDVPKIEPTGDTDVERLSWTNYRNEVAKIPNEDTLHLVRCNYMSSDVAEILSEAGIAFTSHSGARWTPRLLDLYNGVVKVRQTISRSDATDFGLSSQLDFSQVSLSEAKRLMQALKASHHSGTKKSNLEVVKETNDRDDVDLRKMLDIGTVRENIGGPAPFGKDALTTTGVGSEHQRARLQHAFKTQDGQTIESIDHEISTIHGAKGNEAKHVFLHDAISPRIERECRPFPRADPDEARVFFVGATRAAEHLHIVENPSHNTFEFPEVSGQ